MSPNALPVYKYIDRSGERQPLLRRMRHFTGRNIANGWCFGAFRR
jgi:hypothetical protein